MKGFLKVKLIKSPIGSKKAQRETLKCLRLTKLNKQVLVKDTQTVRGMLRKVHHLVDFKEINENEINERDLRDA